MSSKPVKPRKSQDSMISQTENPNFDPEKEGYWGKGERVPFMFMAQGFDSISEAKSPFLIRERLCNMLRIVMETTPDDLLPFVYLLSNKIAPPHHGLHLRVKVASINKIAPPHHGLHLRVEVASIIKALTEARGSTETHINHQYQELGDLGLVAKAVCTSHPLMTKPEPLTVAKVFLTFCDIAKAGMDEQEKKKDLIKSLLVAASDCEPLYLIRLLQMKLRIGQQILLTAIGHAVVYSRNRYSPHEHFESDLHKAAKIVAQVYSAVPVYDTIIPALLAGGVWELPKTCGFSPGVPIGFVLPKLTQGVVTEILDKFQDVEITCEFKYDGERAQIHYLENGLVEIYNRSPERITGKFPGVVSAVTRLRNPSSTSFVLDCELVAFDHEKQKILPFQVLTHAQKNVFTSEIKIEVCIYAFDLLYLNGQSLLEDQLNTRREKLYTSFKEEPGVFQFATAISSNDFKEIHKFLDTAVSSSCEGLVIRTLNKDAIYEPSKRSNNWLKLKKDFMNSVGDTLDLVPIAAFHGHEKRTGVYGSFLLACYDSSKEEFQSICKIGTGLTEAVLEEFSTNLGSKLIPKPKAARFMCQPIFVPTMPTQPIY